MKQFVAILLVGTFMVQTSGKLMLWLHYEMNKEYIAKHLCVNRSNPLLHCNGKCHLAKQLAQDEKREQSPNESLKERFDILLFSESYTCKVALPTLHEDATLYSDYKERPYSTILFSVFHPPQA